MLLFFILTLIFTLAFSQISIVVSIPPLGYIFQQIGGENVKIYTLTHAGDNPHTYNLSPQQVLIIAKASIFSDLGLKDDRWISQKVLNVNPHIRVISTLSNLHRFLIGKDGNYNPHAWLDVKLYEMMCTNVYYALVKSYPSYEPYFSKNFGRLIEKLEALNSRIEKTLSPYKGRPFVAQHPAWDYFARAYGLGKEYTLENNAGQTITPKEYASIILAMKKYHIKAIIGDPVTPCDMTRTLAAQMGVEIVNVNPVYVEDYVKLMEEIAEKFVEALKGE